MNHAGKVIALGISILLVNGGGLSAEQKPLVPWGVYQVATSGQRAWGGEKLRAVLEYGEVGRPRLSVELVDVKMGAPAVRWSRDLNLTGDKKDPCPVAESYCAHVEGLRWVGGTLRYNVVSDRQTINCIATGFRAEAIEIDCDRK